MNGRHIGSNFDDFLAQENLLAECEAGALKRVVTWQIAEEMKRRRISRTTLAGRMKTPRTAIDRIFADNESAVSLATARTRRARLGPQTQSRTRLIFFFRMKTSGSKLGIDATKKIPGEGFKRAWPPLIKMDDAVKAKVEKLFNP